MFLRKVNKSFPESAIKDIMNRDFGHNYELLHNQAKKKNNGVHVYTYIFSVLFLLVGFYFITGSFTITLMDGPFFC
jgi:hypothetical protein